MLKKLKIKPIYRRRFYFVQYLIDVELKQLFINFVVIKFIFLICYFSFFLLIALIKRKKSNPKKEKSSAQLEFVGIFKQELKTFYRCSYFKILQFYAKVTATSLHHRSSNDTKKAPL